MTASISSSFFRFVTSGVANTLASYGLYLALLQVLPYRVGYTVAFACGIMLAYMLNRYFVFRASGGRYGPILVLMIYLGQYLLGLGLVSLWVQWLGGPVALAPLFAAVLLLPATFLLHRLIFRHKQQASQPH